MLKRTVVGLVVVALTFCVASSALAQPGTKLISLSNVSLVGGLGVAVAVNSSEFQSTFNEGITHSLRVEYRFHPRVALYGDYGDAAFNAIVSGIDQVEITSAAAGLVVFGSLNAANTVLAFLDLGAVSNTIKGSDTEFKLRTGGGFDVSVTPQVGIRPAIYINRYAGSPDFIDGVEFKGFLRVTPFGL